MTIWYQWTCQKSITSIKAMPDELTEKSVQLLEYYSIHGAVSVRNVSLGFVLWPWWFVLVLKSKRFIHGDIVAAVCQCAMPILDFCTCIIQRSSVLCGLPDKCIAWAAFTAAGADQQGFSYIWEAMLNGSKPFIVPSQIWEKSYSTMLIVASHCKNVSNY